MANADVQGRQAGQHGIRSEEGQDAIRLIKADHLQVENLFAQFEQAGGQAARQEALAQQIFQALEVHAQLEEEIFYPVVQSKVYDDGDALVEESLQEHQAVKELIHKLRGLTPQSPGYTRTFQELMADVREHVEKEESEMLVDAEEQLGDQLDRLGAEMQRRKQELMSTTR